MFRRTLLAALIAATATTMSAAGKPDYSGNWTLNLSKSEFGPVPAPSKMERSIKHADPALKIVTVQSGQQGDSTSELNYTTDGKEITNTVRNSPVKGAASWDGVNLVVKSVREFQGSELKMNEKWVLAEDGKSLTITTMITAPQGEFELKQVFDRAAAGAESTSAAVAPAAAAKPAAMMKPSAGMPNFSGTWKLNVAKSDFGPMPAPEKQTSKIDHTDPMLKTAITQVGPEGEMSYTISVKTDGTEFKNELRGNPMVGTAKWEGNVLVVNSKLDFQGMEIKIKQKMMLSEDGKTITNSQQLSTPQGDFETKAIMEKVEEK